jgi:hypothetical protein
MLLHTSPFMSVLNGTFCYTIYFVYYGKKIYFAQEGMVISYQVNCHLWAEFMITIVSIYFHFWHNL